MLLSMHYRTSAVKSSEAISSNYFFSPDPTQWHNLCTLLCRTSSRASLFAIEGQRASGRDRVDGAEIAERRNGERWRPADGHHAFHKQSESCGLPGASKRDP